MQPNFIGIYCPKKIFCIGLSVQRRKEMTRNQLKTILRLSFWFKTISLIVAEILMDKQTNPNTLYNRICSRKKHAYFFTQK